MIFAFVLTNLGGGGAEKAVLKTAAALVARGHAAHVVLLEARADYAPPPGVACHVLTAAGRSASRGWIGKRLLARRLAAKIAALAPDLVVSTLPFADEVAALARLPKHWCRIANTLSAEIDKLAQRSPAKAARRRARYRAIYGRRPLIAVSAGVTADLRERLGLTTRIETVANPFDARAIAAAAAQPAALPDAPYVVHVGRFAPQKRHDLLLDAWVRLDLPHRLVLLTAPDPALTALIAARGLQQRVVVAGFQSNPYPWIAGAELLVLCSDHEGLPNVLIEALLCATPVVATDCPSGPREILGAALADALVPCGDAAALAAAIERTLAAPPDLARLDLGRYDAGHTAAAYERLAQAGGTA